VRNGSSAAPLRTTDGPIHRRGRVRA